MIDEVREELRGAPGPAAADTAGAAGTAGASTPGLAALVSGIVHDAQELTRQQFALFKQEMTEDFRKTREVAVAWAVALAAALIASLMLAVTIAELLAWGTPIPRWVCYLIVTILAGLGAVALGYAGKKKLESFNPLPDQSVRALKENVQCLTNPR